MYLKRQIDAVHPSNSYFKKKKRASKVNEY